MTDQIFLGLCSPTENWRQRGTALTIDSNHKRVLTIDGDHKYCVIRTVLIGVWTCGKYEDIVLDERTALRFAEALQDHFAKESPR